MKLKINSRLVNEVTILDLSGEVVLGEESKTLRKTLKDLVESGNRKVLLNLGAVSYIDTSGLGTLVSAYGDMASQQGQLKLLNLTKRVQTVLQITKLLTVFESFNNEEAALKSF